jgi:hypothetical protein
MEKYARVAAGSRPELATGSAAVTGTVHENAKSSVKTTEIDLRRMAKLQFAKIVESCGVQQLMQI